jgi:Glycosyl hydrolases family 28
MRGTSRRGQDSKSGIPRTVAVVVSDVSHPLVPVPHIHSQTKSDPEAEDAKNITFQNFTVSALRGQPFSITQCTTFSGVAGDCNSSEFLIEDIAIEDIEGTIDADPIASYQCSAAAPCQNISMLDVALTVNGSAATGWKCSNLVGAVGFAC